MAKKFIRPILKEADLNKRKLVMLVFLVFFLKNSNPFFRSFFRSQKIIKHFTKFLEKSRV